MTEVSLTSSVWLGKVDNLSVLSGGPGEVHICAHRGERTIAFTLDRKQMNFLMGALGRADDMDEAAHLSFTCPQCHRTSYSPMDIEEGYCGACHDWTGDRGR